jgi:hypothetical protein
MVDIVNDFMQDQNVKNFLKASLDRGSEFVVHYRKWTGSGPMRKPMEFLEDYRDYWQMNRARNGWDDEGYRAKRVFDLTYDEAHDMA